MKKQELIKIWEEFCKKADFKLNTDKWQVDTVAQGVLENDADYGLKLCPCRISDGSKESKLSLICPCNFKAQDNWKEKGMCWCGLFIKK